MTPIRITAPFVQYGSAQLTQGLTLEVPEVLATAFEAEGSAERLSKDEWAATKAQCSSTALLAPVAKKGRK